MARAKKTIHSGVSKEQFETAFAAYATAEAKRTKVTASMEVQFVAIREKNADMMAKCQDEMDANFEVMQAYAIENKDELFAKKKSLESVHGTIGFRTGTPKLKTLKGFTWASVTNLLKEFLPDYVRTTEEPAKDRLLADREKEEIAALFTKSGIAVTQDETFYVEPKKDQD